jgi:hypothetical protein
MLTPCFGLPEHRFSALGLGADTGPVAKALCSMSG